MGTSAAPGMMVLRLLTRGTVYLQLTQEESLTLGPLTARAVLSAAERSVAIFSQLARSCSEFEGEAGFMKLEGSAVDPRTSSDVLGSAKIGDWYAMITPRLGYAWDRTLLYVKAGVAFVPVQASVVDSCFSIAAGCNNGVISTAGSHTFTTYTVGGGLEWAFADRWSVKGEYMFIGLGNNKTLTTCGLARTAAGTVPGAEFCFGHEFRSVQTFKIGLNYLFGPL